MSAHSHQHPHFGNAPPNPLRPYYIPPPVAPFADASASSVAAAASQASSSAASAAITNFGVPSNYTILQDFQDYSSDYLESPSMGEAMRGFLEHAILKYTQVLISQPFEVAKTVLQCQYVPRQDIRGKGRAPRGSATSPDEYAGDDDDGKSDAEEDNPWTNSNHEGDVRRPPSEMSCIRS